MIIKNKKIFISILIPCLNEEKTIKKSVSDALKNGKKYFGKNFEVLVSDNGSTDKTLEILKNIKGIRLLKISVKGYGSALHNGILNAKGDFVIFADADLSYPFSNIRKFKNVINNGYDLVLGSRLMGRIQKNSMPFLHRYFGTPILTTIIRFMYKIKTTDCNSGMRMVKKSFYKKLNMKNSGMEWASELLCKTALHKGNYFEVPINFNKDKRKRKPHLSTWSDGWRHLKAIILLKSKSIFYLSVTTFVISVIFYGTNFALAYFFCLISEVLFLAYLALQLLESIIENKWNNISKFLIEFKIVQILIALTVIEFMLLSLISDNHMGTKLILTSFLSIAFMWAFLIETIKTHLVNKL